MGEPANTAVPDLVEAEALIDSVRDYAIFMLDPQGVVRTWNLGAQAIKGYAADEIIGKSFTTFYTAEDRARGLPQQLLGQAIEAGRVESEGWRVRKDGTRFWADVIITAIRARDGRLRGFAKVTRDLTERMRAADRLRASEQQTEEERERTARARQELRGRDDFIVATAHELRTPLTALQLTLEGLDRAMQRPLDANRADRTEQRLEVALRQVQRLSDLVERLLDVSRMVAGRVELHREELDLGALTLGVLADLQRQARDACPTIQVQVIGDVRGYWDRHWINHVISNLVANALKYGAGQPIEVAVEDAGALVRATVTDRGIGMAPEVIERIFGRFERAVSLRNYAGLGLGLFLARQAVEAHGGTIRVTSAPDAGSSFVIELPRGEAVPPAGSAA